MRPYYQVAARFVVFGFAYLLLAIIFVATGIDAADLFYWLGVSSTSVWFHIFNITVSLAMLAAGLWLYAQARRLKGIFFNEKEFSKGMKLKYHIGVRLIVYGVALLVLGAILSLIGVDLKKLFFGLDVFALRLYLVPLIMIFAGIIVIYLPRFLRKK